MENKVHGVTQQWHFNETYVVHENREEDSMLAFETSLGYKKVSLGYEKVV